MISLYFLFTPCALRSAHYGLWQLRLLHLEDGILAVLLFDRKRGGLYFPLTLQCSVLSFLLFLFGGIVSEEVELDSTVIFLRCVRFRQDMICHNIHTADKQILVHDPVEEF